MTACGTFFSKADKALLTNDELQVCRTMGTSISEAYQSRDSAALSKEIGEWDNYSNNLRDVIGTYNEINQTPFAGAAAKLRAKRDHTNEWCKQHRSELVKLVETDPEAAAKLAELRAKDVDSTLAYIKRLEEQAKIDPEVAAKLAAQIEYRRAYCRGYHRKAKATEAGKELVDVSA